MKLVLLPGMDGTGLLFEPLLPHIHNIEVLVLPLPNNGAQDYKTLAAYVVERLPKEDFILVAESFSGGIAAHLSQQSLPHLKGIIFVASFLSAPKKALAYLASFLPIRQLAQLPFSGVVHRFLFLGKEAGTKEIELFKSALDSVTGSALKLRLMVIAQSGYDGFKSGVPVVYLAATQDRLVPAMKKQEFVQAYTSIAFAEIDGPHFILQANPKDSAAAILKAANLIVSKNC